MDELFNVVIPRHETLSIYFVLSLLLYIFRSVRKKSNYRYQLFLIIGIILSIYPRHFKNWEKLSYKKAYAKNFISSQFFYKNSENKLFDKRIYNQLPKAISSGYFIPSTDWFIEKTEMNIIEDASFDDTDKKALHILNYEVRSNILFLQLQNISQSDEIDLLFVTEEISYNVNVHFKNRMNRSIVLNLEDFNAVNRFRLFVKDSNLDQNYYVSTNLIVYNKN